MRKSDNNSEHELDILSAGMRLAYDDFAIIDLLNSWNARFEHSNGDLKEAEERGLFSKLRMLEPLYESVDDHRFLDETEKAILTVASPAFVFSPDGMVVELNDLAAKRFSIRQGARCNFSFVDDLSIKDLNSLRTSARQNGNQHHTIIQVTAENAQPSYAEVYKISQKERQSSLLALRVLEIEWSEDVSSQLDQAFGLTSSEIDVCRLFYRSKDLAKISERRAVVKRTVAIQMSAIFQKTGAKGQVELYSLLSLICARAERGRTSGFQPWSDPYGREQIVETADGKRIAYSWFGAENGRPVILLHGLAAGYAMDPSVEDILDEAGLKILAVCRPRHGNSDAIAGKGAADSATNALSEFVDILELEPCLGVGLGIATAPLFELASRRTNVLTGILSIGGTLPISRAEYAKQLPAIHRAVVTMFARAPWLGKILARRFFGTLKRKGYSPFLEMYYAESTIDQELINSPEVRPLILSALSLMTSQGVDAFVEDMGLTEYDWLEVMSKQNIFYRVLHGEFDPSTCVDELKRLTTEFDRMSVVPFSGSGELIFYEQPRRIIEELIKFDRECR
ncbi:MAG: alpha/beta hydrolase [Lentilitoribacter sp.]